MRRVSIEELPAHSPWPARLLGLEEFLSRKRTVEHLMREYDRDKYGACRAYLSKHPNATIEQVKWFERRGKAGKLCISMDGKLFESSVIEAYRTREKKFLDIMRFPMTQCDTVIELGAGYGYNLALLRKKYPRYELLGGELSPNGIQLARALVSPNNIAMHPFRFQERRYRIFDATESSRILVLTYHSAEMLRSADVLLRRLAAHKRRICRVVQLEPVFEMADPGTMLGALRRAYIRANDYNEDLLPALRGRKDIRLLRSRYDVFGTNALFPESLVEWKFV